MNREIKFRGKKISNGEWVYGSFHQYNDHPGIVAILENVEAGTIYSVDPETVGQFTGMTDKEGKEIFEGDIIYASHFRPLIVGFCQESAAFGACNDLTMNIDKMFWFYNNIVLNQDDWYIIGNIHDNKDLIPKT